MTFLYRIIDAITAIVPQIFAVNVELNSADFSTDGLTIEEAYDQIQWIDEHGSIDFIEISDVTYEGFALTEFEHDT
ncbi:unnamed protein product [Rotaria sp. Silwood1]|nr:unnamed protein product [Rotaria sp. Silwood1]CAF1158906.1 unnamed protein product [Rotaria sp. Silwood1]CAF3461601.1 unnamed protein product [Rotaria sp. Silwood1]CAF3468336.1 unnamed protein product [Rotaria sp. Silwood1]CAF4624934.1 unnamed protein product [Rotaria sp. Silwood1]